MFGSGEAGLQDLVILSERTEHLPFIEIRIKECEGKTALPPELFYWL